VDLESRKPIELLPDRSVETVEAWLRSHPEITIVSRDRGGDYAAAARNGAPQAEQIADRFHLLLNLRVKLKDLMIRQHKLLPMSSVTRSDAIPQKARGISSLYAPTTAEEHVLLPPPAPSKQRASVAQSPELLDRANRTGRYEAVNQLWKRGKSIRFIAKHLNMARVKVRRYLSAACLLKSLPPLEGKRLRKCVERHVPRWFSNFGSKATPNEPLPGISNWLVRRFTAISRIPLFLNPSLFPGERVSSIRSSPTSWPVGRRDAATEANCIERSKVTGIPDQTRCCANSSATCANSSKQRRRNLTRLPGLCVIAFLRPEPHGYSFVFLKSLVRLQHICAAHTELEAAYRLTQAFVNQLKNRSGAEAVDAWLLQAEQSGIPELKSFAKGIHHDESAVKAAFSSPGQTVKSRAR
jgi:hypothetical protein